MNTIEVNFQPATRFFVDVSPRALFYPGVNGTSRYGACVKLSRPTYVKPGNVALPFLATAVSKRGILLHIEDDEMVFFTSETDKRNGAMNQPKISVIAGYYFFEGPHKDQPVEAYIWTTGQLM
jgi:alpha-glucosidase (family GH31 glycosyl hydrolase)